MKAIEEHSVYAEGGKRSNVQRVGENEPVPDEVDNDAALRELQKMMGGIG